MIVERLINPTPDDIAQILTMFREIPGRTCTVKNFLLWMDRMWEGIHVAVIRDEQAIHAFQIAVAPGLLEPEIGKLPFSFCKAGTPPEDIRSGMQMAEDWLRERGATKYRFGSVRSGRALKRKYGMTPSKEVLYEKCI